MKHTTLILTAVLIAGITLMSLENVSAQEWRVLIDKNIFTAEQQTQALVENSGREQDWLATQSPLLRNTPITSTNTVRNLNGTPRLETEFPNIGSWSPVEPEPGKENFTIFSF